MGFFDKFKDAVSGGTPEEKAARKAEREKAEAARVVEKQRQDADIELLKQGGIPAMARARLEELARENAESQVFSGNLAPDELALLRKAGYRARGLVSGSCMYQVTLPQLARSMDMEDYRLSGAYDEAMRLAIERMREELKILGADGVVGVRMEVLRRGWGGENVEVQLIGTAVEANIPENRTPWLSDLSVQEWYALKRAGYEPVDIAYGHCAWKIRVDLRDQRTLDSWVNAELTHWSDALRQARDTAMGYTHERTKKAQGTGIVGVRMTKRVEHELVESETNKNITLLIAIVGTAIRPAPGAPPAVPQTLNILSLREGALRPWLVKHPVGFDSSDTYEIDDIGEDFDD